MNKAVRNWFNTIELKWVLIGVAGYAMMIFIGLNFLVQPQSDNYLNAVENQAGINETYVNLINLDIETAITSVEAQHGKLNLLKFRFDSRLFKNTNLNLLTPVIDRYCVNAELKVLKLESLNETKFIPPKYQKIFIGVSLEGKYSNFLKLLNTLESHPEWILVEDFTITPVEKGSLSKIDLLLSVLKEKDST